MMRRVCGGTSTPLGIAFYTGSSFPAEYKGDAFGRLTGVYEDFAIGFVSSDESVWGRPVGRGVAPDGSLFVSDDGSGTIWRIAYKAR